MKRPTHKRISNPNSASAGGEVPKRAYDRPSLWLYGSVSKLTRGFGGTQVDFFMFNNTMMASDRRLKDNIVRIDTHPLGFGLYLFDFRPEHKDRWGTDRQFGVMADEVETVVPRAVRTHADGYKRVDYHMLGIRHARSGIA